MTKIQLDKNNLGKSSSPYLRQHADNPIHWQEWSSEIIELADKLNKHILVSIGYSTCHWCHVMASEAFSDLEIAQYLNENFISVKVDREQRPDIDQHFMMFINKTTGGGGWPLNVFLSPKGDPITAFTYIPIQRKFGMPSMIEILKAVRTNSTGVRFEGIESANVSSGMTLDLIVSTLEKGYDQLNGGFGNDHKFPPHCTLLFLISYYERYKNPRVKAIIENTLQNMMIRGLHDHLQGGFFRYCVDSQWTIPHFEKMLYDQAMMLWVYSWAYTVFKKEEYKEVIDGIEKCLDETFLDDGLYISAHDADTEHHEGKTYLWTLKELRNALDPDEFLLFTNNYNITESGNFEKANHLIRRIPGKRGILEKKLLMIRKKRVQPFADKKIITSWNALTAIGFVMAWRATGNELLLDKAVNVLEKLIQKHFNGTTIAHSSLDGLIQNHGFLEDASALLLLATYIHEEKRDRKDLLYSLKEIVLSFRKDKWIENKNNDFTAVAASDFDHPAPSSTSLAEMAILRTSILMNEKFSSINYKTPFSNDFYNLSAFISEGHWHLIHTPEKLPWNKLSLNSIQVFLKEFSDCYEEKCSPVIN